MRTAPSPSAPPILVGRDRELAVLRARLAAADEGQGSLVLIGGEAGIGKTALAEALCREAEEKGALVLVGRCYDLSETPPYGPWVELFKHYPTGNTLPPLPATFAHRGILGPVEGQTALFEAIQDLFTTLATQYPLILVFEDAHWADPASLDLLRFLARGLRTLPLVLLVTYRADELTRHHPLYAALPVLVREASAIRLDLAGLSDAALHSLVATRYHLIPAEETRLVVYLRARAEGNTLFTIELLRTLEERGELAVDWERWHLRDLTGVAVPPLLRQVIDARVSRLGEEAHRLLSVAAVIGQTVPFAVWTAMVGEDEEVLFAVIEQASAARVAEATADGLGFRFLHALIREALYEGTLPPRRRGLHRHVAEILFASPIPDPDELVYHLRQAGDRRLSEWLVKAGMRAMDASAEITARARYEEALPLLTSPDTASTRFYVLMWLVTLSRFQRESIGYGEEAVRIARELGDEMREAVALLRLGHVRCINGNIRCGLAELERAVAMLATFPNVEPLRSYMPYSRQVGDRGRGLLAVNLAFVGRIAEAQALVNAGNPVGNGWYALMACEAALGRPDAARALLRQFIAEELAAGDFRNRGYAWNLELTRIVIPYRADDPAEVQRVAAAAEMALAQVGEAVVGFPSRVPWLPVWIIHGQWEEAWSLLASVRQYRHGSYSDGLYSPWRGMLARAQGKTALAWEFVHELFPDGVTTAPGTVPLRQALALQETAALLALDDGDLEAARQWMETQDHWLTWSGAVLGQSEGQALWAQYYRQTGDAAQAGAHAERALVHATNPRQPLALLAAHRLHGELATDAGRFDDAATHLNTALALAEACAAPFERALTLLGFAELHATTGHESESWAGLAAVRAICTPLGATPTLARANHLATRLTTQGTPQPVGPDRLTIREREVLRLVAEGMSNREIAVALFISERTVNRHMTNLYTKIDAHSKVDATAYAIRHHLA